MKILSIERNDFGQVIATVLNCGKEWRIFAGSVADLPKAISKALKFVAPSDVLVDLELNYGDFK
jgi:hypothetical protein